MKQNKTRRERLLSVCYAGLIAAIYTVLTCVVGAFGLANGAIQLRLSEALCVLPIFTSAAIPGLAIGCLLSNIFLSGIWQDVIFGTLATLIGALGAYLLRKFPLLVPLPTVIANALIIPFVLAYGYGMEEGIWYLMLTVGIGEILSAYVVGLVLLFVFKRYEKQLFLK